MRRSFRQSDMKPHDWVWLGSVLLWGLFGFWTGEAYQRHDSFAVWFGVGLWVIFPLATAMRIVISQARWRREWARRHGKPWSESEAARLERERGQ
jgi:Na+-driven multidrug efflux pump